MAQDKNNGSAMGCGVGALAALGEFERTKEWINRALLIAPDNLNMRYNCVCGLAAHLKDKEASLDLLGPFFEKAPSDFLAYAKVDVDLDFLRDDPRFQAMVAAAKARLVQTSGRAVTIWRARPWAVMDSNPSTLTE